MTYHRAGSIASITEDATHLGLVHIARNNGWEAPHLDLWARFYARFKYGKEGLFVPSNINKALVGQPYMIRVEKRVLGLRPQELPGCMRPDYRVRVFVRVEMPGTPIKDPVEDPEGFDRAYRAAPRWEDVLCSPRGVTIAIACARSSAA